eukprot:TRINITY_DN430_c0_g2_i1.p1 TRINITY_DN430_c0_g2~~TRINITY_DN430_c0_g2_i1.p1  ORF type:complete len:4080 (+),score=854.57 TRINITY_DN430_c0_g2_i1:199-12438(+)
MSHGPKGQGKDAANQPPPLPPAKKLDLQEMGWAPVLKWVQLNKPDENRATTNSLSQTLRPGASPAPPQNGPSRRLAMSFTAMPVGKLVLFGGCSSDGYQNDTYTLDPVTFSWKEYQVKGEPPSKRCCHTATVLDTGKLVIFGGQICKQRLYVFNDIFILDAENSTWIVPEVKGTLPPPRARHTATMFKHKLYVFGGYAQNTSPYDDLWVFDFDTSEWTKPNCTGNPPAPRFGHSAVLIGHQLFIIGGITNNYVVLRTVAVLDLHKLHWQSVEDNFQLPEPLAMSSAIVTPSGGFSKIFLFGGQTQSTTKFSNDIFCFDTDIISWSKIEVEGDMPLGRSQCGIVYDDTKTSLILFGGWGNQFLNDIFYMDIGDVVGPPYHISKIDPALGPQFGNALVKIHGEGFFSTSDVEVKFTDGTQSVSTQGKVASSYELNITSPSFHQFSREASLFVRVSLAGGRATVSRRKYMLFLDTKSSNCLAYGPGLLEEVYSGVPVSLVIFAKDYTGASRRSGGDPFKVEIMGMEAQMTQFTDMLNGTYVVSYIPKGLGKFYINILLDDNPIRGSPFLITAVPDKDNVASKTTLESAVASFVPVMRKTIPAKISSMRQKIVELDKQLDTPIRSDDLKALLRVMSSIEEARKVKENLEVSVASLRESVTFMEAHGEESIGKLGEELNELGKNWAGVKRKAVQVVKSMRPLQEKAKVGIREDIESFNNQVKDFCVKFKGRPMFLAKSGPAAAYTEIDQVNKALVDLEAEGSKLRHLASLFESLSMIQESIDTLGDRRNELLLLKYVWDVTAFIRFQTAMWKETKWPDIKADEMESECKTLTKELRTGAKEAKDWNVYKELLDEIKVFQSACPIVGLLRHPSMRDRHWEMLIKATGVPITVSEKTTLQQLIDLELPKHEKEVERIVDIAMKEEKIEANLNKLEKHWKNVTVTFSDHKSTNLKLVSMREEDFESLEEHQVLVQTMLVSKYLQFFSSKVEKWHVSLENVNEVMQCANQVQRKWAYLLNLFTESQEVKKELPEVSNTFLGIDVDVRDFLKLANTTTNILILCNQEGLLVKLRRVEEMLETCEKALFDYLEAKQNRFPRFYFVSTVDLLDILCNGSKPANIQIHMSKLFQAIKSLKLVEPKDPAQPVIALGMTSNVGDEYVPFHEQLLLKDSVVDYLDATIDIMRNCLKHILRQAVIEFAGLDPDESRDGDKQRKMLMEYPSQISILTRQICFTSEVNDAFHRAENGQKDALKEYTKRQRNRLAQLIDMVRGDLTSGVRQKAMVIITLDTHARDIIQYMADNGADTHLCFEWQSQLRFLWDEEKKDSEIRICDAYFDYGYEYLGNGPRLVITPLTDRIYITATQSLHLKMGCAPAGPAGTGKTETTKDLASQLGRAVYVFNCSDQMDYRSMGNIFKGLAASGSWGCFDEFNRLMPEVLSVCSTQFRQIVDALKMNKPDFTIEGSTLLINPTCGVFITMNPGYLGRSELPESLKALFRPITVVVPDLELICENMLMAEGFMDAKVLARKFITLYSLLRDSLSKQSHYDWGLRAIKSVLTVAGSFKRADPNIPESGLLMRALRDSNLAKIPSDDVPVFMGLINDLFPGMDIPRKRDVSFEDTIKSVCIEQNLWPSDLFILKVVQLQELMIIRHCVFLIGSPGTGKSEVWKTLMRASTKAGRPTTVRDLNPKSITSNELYGYVQASTREWQDGLLSNMMRELGNIPNTDPKWIILDGDLDANWIESMNSVMDDNKILTLASNERIPLLPHMRLIFEIRDLKYATPATVSRAGIIFLSDAHQYEWYFMSWLQLKEISPGQKEIIRKLYHKYVPEILSFIQKNCKQAIDILDFSMVQVLCFLLDGLLEGLENTTPETEENAAAHQANNVHFEPLFIFGCIWAFGGGLTKKDNIDYRARFSDWWKVNMKSVKVPQRASIFEVCYDKATKTFVSWAIPAYVSPPGTIVEGTSTFGFVPTTESTALSYLMKMLIERGRPVMLVGGVGSGKTALVKQVLRQLPEDMTFHTISLNYYTDSFGIQRLLEQPLEKKAGRNFGPPGTKKLVFFIDDINMPMLDNYGTQTPIALLRQHVDYTHWYDRSRLSYQGIKVVHNCQYVSCMNPAAGSFTIDPRLQRHFATFAVDIPGNTSLVEIYQTLLQSEVAKQNFPQQMMAIIPNIVNAALMLHNKTFESFRKTAANFHYEWNLRHLTGVFLGTMQIRAQHFVGEEGARKFVELWLHESERIYSDRLSSANDIATYRGIAKDTYSKYFADMNLGHLFRERNSTPLLFCHFAHGMGENNYDKIADLDKLREIMEESLREYNEENPQMNLLLFDDAIKHVAHIARIVMQSQGHALLVGVGGSGKQSLTRLAAYICGYTVVQPSSGSVSVNEFKEELKQLFTRSGIKDTGLLFMLTDAQIAEERFLIFINDYLSLGDIPDLFAKDERDNLVSQVRKIAKSLGLDDSYESCWNLFLSRVRRNLHVAMCFSPVGESLRIRYRRFPGLVNCSTIDWFHPWPEQALLSVAKKFLAEVDLSEEIKEGITQFMPYAFKTVNDASARFSMTDRRHVYTTPKSFLEAVILFKVMLNRRRTELNMAIDRMTAGLDKLEVTARDVEILDADLQTKMVEVEQKKKAAEIFAAQIGSEKERVEAENAKAQIEAKNCEFIQVDVSARQTKCESELAAAEPAVARAIEALNSLTKKDMSEMKALKSPPEYVVQVAAAVRLLLSPSSGVHKDVSWAACQKMMGKLDQFLSTLMSFKDEVDRGVVPAANFKAVRSIITQSHFNKETISTVSRAAAGLCEWVVNIVEFYDIMCNVLPMRDALSEAQTQLEQATTKLSQVQALVADLNEQLANLETEYNQAVNERNAVIAEAERCRNKLDLAQRLVRALASEKVRWGNTVSELHKELEVLPGDVLLASSFVSYIGPFSQRYRLEILNDEWCVFLRKNKVPLSDNVDPLKVLTDSAIIASWRKMGLPDDRVSVENAAIVANSERWPLIIDPQLQGLSWIKEKEAKNGLKVIRQSTPHVLTILEAAIQDGNSVLVENLGETIDPLLGPIVNRRTFKRMGRLFVQIGDREVEWHKDFRMYLHTKLGNPHYPPEIQAETALVNFAVTEEGLNDQLLATVVGKERPDLEEQMNALIRQQNDFKISLKELEDSILAKLAAAQGDLTEDVDLIESLEETKRIAGEMQEKVKIAQETESKIKATRELYRGVSARGSLLFFLLTDMGQVHSFYQFSLATFITVFLRGIDLAINFSPAIEAAELAKLAAAQAAEEKAKENSKDPKDIKAREAKLKAEAKAKAEGKKEAAAAQPTVNPLIVRLKSLIESITYSVFSYVRRGLFETHKLIFSSYLCLKILMKEKSSPYPISSDEMEFLIKARRPAVPPPLPGPLRPMLTDGAWATLNGLMTVEPFKQMADTMMEFPDDWTAWLASEMPERETVPHHPQKSPFNAFQLLLLIRTLRPDRLTSAMQDYVALQLGRRYVDQDPLDMVAVYNESNAVTPIFFILFPGAAPYKDIEFIGRKYGFTEENGKLVGISMGQGQEKRAEQCLDNFIQNGGWIFLDNVHLMQRWLPTFETKLEKAADGAHPDFRVFFSAEHSPDPTQKSIPESVVKSSIKLVNEHPQHLRANLRRALFNFDEDFMTSLPSEKEDVLRTMLFALCFFHSSVLGRRKFGWQGWSRIYHFNFGDLSICGNILINYLGNSATIPWADIRYMIGEIMYGGHITDKWDRRTCSTYLTVLLTPGLFEQAELAQGFNCPAPSTLEAYRKYVDDCLPPESPILLGLHPNAEIGFQTLEGNILFTTISDLQGNVSSGAGAGAGGSEEAAISRTLEGLLRQIPENFNLLDIVSRIPERSPYIVVFLQECERMNILISEIRRSLNELKMGLAGLLNFTESMEALQLALITDRVPASWEKVAYPSLKKLGAWFGDLLLRVKQLTNWTRNLERAVIVWLPGLFNPMAYLTAIIQVTARSNKYALDDMVLQTDIYVGDETEIKGHPPSGGYINGFFLEGARWDSEADCLAEEKPKELHSPVPVMFVTATRSEDLERVGRYECPVYLTAMRGATYVFTTLLKTNDPPEKWVLSGTALLMSDD